MRIALAGNPNSGKTTMFNVLTGSNEKVGNWAGVTVDKKEHSVKKAYYKGDQTLIAVDLPGAYSMSPFTSEESITSDYVRNERPDVVINIVDATNLSRSLFFTTQLLELGIPVVVALNKSDVNQKKETRIDVDQLSLLLGCQVVETVSKSAKGIEMLVNAAVNAVGSIQSAPYVQDSKTITDKASSIEADKKRFEFVNGVVSKVECRKIRSSEKNFQDKIDAFITNKIVGIPIFAAIMFAVFWISQTGPAVWFADWLVGLLENGQSAVSDLIPGESIWKAMLIEGVVGGVIAVIGFLPLVMVMYFLIALLEDCGYMARAAVVLDPIFKRVGLSGKSVIPFIVGTGCAVPGVMASRTIRDERERRATAMLAPFMPCGAKLPVIALFSGVFFGDAAWVGALMYFVGIAVIFLGALLVSLLTGYKRRSSFFIMELPEYKVPSFIKAIFSMCQRGWSYIVKAGTVILVCNFAVHVMQNFTWSFQIAENAGDSILASIATPFAYLFAPTVGFVSWQLAAAVITGFIAKENVVGTLAVCFGITNLINVDELAIEGSANVSEIALAFGQGSGSAMISATALAYLMLNLFTPPCFAAIGAMNAEIKSKKWLFAGIGLQLSVGYTIAFFVNLIGTLLSGGKLVNTWTYLLGFAVVGAIVAIFAVMIIRKRKQMKLEYELKKAAKISAA